MRVKNFAHRVSCACPFFPPCIETALFECWRRQPMSIHSFYQMTNVFPLPMIPRDSLQSLILTQRNGLSCLKKKCSNQKKMSLRCAYDFI